MRVSPTVDRDANALSFQVLNAQGQLWHGSSTINLTGVGAQGGSHQVLTDPVTGIAPLRLLNARAGFTKFRLQLANGFYVDSKIYDVVSRSTLTKPIQPFGP